MKVKTLIQYLEKKNPEARVMLNYRDVNECLFCVSEQGKDDVIWLEGEHDMDLSAELEARYEHAIETGIDELDFYMELLEIGITMVMVARYMGREHAEHMKAFCNEHGLI